MLSILFSNPKTKPFSLPKLLCSSIECFYYFKDLGTKKMDVSFFEGKEMKSLFLKRKKFLIRSKSKVEDSPPTSSGLRQKFCILDTHETRHTWNILSPDETLDFVVPLDSSTVISCDGKSLSLMDIESCEATEDLKSDPKARFQRVKILEHSRCREFAVLGNRIFTGGKWMVRGKMDLKGKVKKSPLVGLNGETVSNLVEMGGKIVTITNLYLNQSGWIRVMVWDPKKMVILKDYPFELPLVCEVKKIDERQLALFSMGRISFGEKEYEKVSVLDIETGEMTCAKVPRFIHYFDTCPTLGGWLLFLAFREQESDHELKVHVMKSPNVNHEAKAFEVTKATVFSPGFGMVKAIDDSQLLFLTSDGTYEFWFFNIQTGEKSLLRHGEMKELEIVTGITISREIVEIPLSEGQEDLDELRLLDLLLECTPVPKDVLKVINGFI